MLTVVAGAVVGSAKVIAVVASVVVDVGAATAGVALLISWSSGKSNGS